MQKWQQPWNAAKAASRRSIRKYKPVGPVGSKLEYYDNEHGPKRMWLALCDAENTKDALSCKDCGYHVCSCKPEFERTQLLGHYDSMSFRHRPQLPRTLAGRIDLLGALSTFAPVDREAALGLLLKGYARSDETVESLGESE